MHSSSSERPSSATNEARESSRGSTVTLPDRGDSRAPRRARAPMPTLIGVAPAAPIAGRPDLEHGAAVDDLLQPLSSPPRESVASHDPPLSCVRPRVDQSNAPPRVAPPPAPFPKHTLDAISIGDEPVAARRRNRVAGIVLAMAMVMALAIVGRRLAARDVPSARPTAPPPAAASSNLSASDGTPPAMGATATPAPASSATSTASDRPTSVAPKPRHAKPPVRRKGSTPPHAH